MNDIKIEILEEFTIKCPRVYIYKIQKDYYFIGGCVFKFCSKNDINNFKKFEDEFNKVKKITKNFVDLKQEDIYKLKEYYNEYILVHEQAVNDENINNVKKKINLYIESMSDDDLNSLLEQKNKRDEILRYINNKKCN